MPSILHSHDGLHVLGAGPILFAIWDVVPTMERLRSLQEAGDRHRDEIGGRKQVFVNVAAGGRPDFTDEVREEAARQTRRSADWRLATAHVILIPGLRGLAVRTFMSTVLLLGRPPVPTRVFSDMPQAARWLAGELGGADGWTPERLIAAYGEARAAVATISDA